MTFVKELTLDEAVSSPLFITVIGGLYPFFVCQLLKNKQNRALKESVILLNSM
jgi:hypothetical protein